MFAMLDWLASIDMFALIQTTLLVAITMFLGLIWHEQKAKLVIQKKEARNKIVFGLANVAVVLLQTYYSRTPSANQQQPSIATDIDNLKEKHLQRKKKK